MDWIWIVVVVLAIPAAALVALVMVITQRGQIAELRRRIDALETARILPADTIPSTTAPETTSTVAPSEPVAATPAKEDDAGQEDDRADEDRDDGQPTADDQAGWGTATPAADWTTIPTAATTAGASMPAASTTTARDGPDLETQLGSRWAVILGGLTLALGGVFLVRYSIEAGLLGPGARIVLGALFAIALLATGEILRRRSPPVEPSGVTGLKAVSIPAVLTAAGTSSLFATVFAAHGLYGFIGPAIAFPLLGAIAVATMLLSALHGRGLAALGLVGAYTAPLLVSSTTPNTAALFLYLGFVTVAAFGVARLRQWRWLAITASGFALGWGFFAVLLGAVPFDELALGLYVVALLGLVVLFLIVDVYRDGLDGAPGIDIFALMVTGLTALLAVAINASADHHVFTLVVGLAMTLTMIWTAARYPPAGGLAIIATLLALFVMAGFDVPYDARDPVGALAPAGPLGLAPVVPERVVAFRIWATLFGAALMAGFLAFGATSGTRGLLALAAALGPVALLAIAYWRIAAFQPTAVFIGLALLLAGLNALQTDIAMRRSRGQGHDERAIGFAAAGSVAALCLGLTMLFETGWLTVSLALLAAALAWLATLRAISGLGPLAIVVAAIVVGRTLHDPLLIGFDLGTTPIVNGLLWVYGLTALAFAYAGRTFRRLSAPIATAVFDVLAIVYAALLVALEIHHAVSGGDMRAEPALGTVGAWVSLPLVIAVLLHWQVDKGASRAIYRLQRAALWIGIAGSAYLIAANPLLLGLSVGDGRLLNGLIPAYLLPALALGAYALVARQDSSRVQTIAAAIAALVMGFVWITLAIRRFFLPFDTLVAPAGAELYAYSVGWLVYGIALLAAGFVLNIRLLRTASALVIVLAVLKAFLVDMAELDGVLRALSFIGLGLVLIAIGLVYQRLLSRRDPPRGAGPEGPPSEPAAGALRDAA